MKRGVEITAAHRLKMEKSKEEKKAAQRLLRAKEIAANEEFEEKRREERIKRRSEPVAYRNYRNSADRRRIEFNLSIEVFNELANSNCTYCGGKGGGVDRLNSKIGYIIENSVSCCGKCNMMKHTHSVEDFINQVNKIADHNKNNHGKRNAGW